MTQRSLNESVTQHTDELRNVGASIVIMNVIVIFVIKQKNA
jgi:hypothetical protein